MTVDLWGTLLLDLPASDDRYKQRRMRDFENILAGAGVRVAARALDRAYDASASYLGRLWSENRDVPVSGHVVAILSAVDRGLPRRLSADVTAALADAYARPALIVPPTVDPGALAAMQRLAAEGRALAVVSNTMRTPGLTLRKVLERYGLLGQFARLTFSDEVGVRKPDPRIFALTLDALGVAPADALHVGDDPVLDVRGARAAGMRVVQVISGTPAALAADRPDAVVPTLASLPATIARLEA